MVSAQEIFDAGIPYEHYKNAIGRGVLILLRKGTCAKTTMLDANSPYLRWKGISLPCTESLPAPRQDTGNRASQQMS